mgnify:CR=1 FL=1
MKAGKVQKRDFPAFERRARVICYQFHPCPTHELGGCRSRRGNQFLFSGDFPCDPIEGGVRRNREWGRDWRIEDMERQSPVPFLAASPVA